jgi:hypothetical protein
VSYPLVLSDSIAGRAHAVAPTFACSRSGSGLHAAWVHRLVILRGPPDVDRRFAMTANSGDVENGSVDHVEPPIEPRLTAVGGDQSAIEGHQS